MLEDSDSFKLVIIVFLKQVYIVSFLILFSRSSYCVFNLTFCFRFPIFPHFT